MRFWFGILVLSLILVPEQDLARPSALKFVHPGTIADAYTQKGILAAASAYGSPTSSGAGAGCPTYLELLDAQKSSSGNGDFDFHIDSAKSAYLAVYCQAGYAPRTETNNDNSVDGSRVQPDPVTLYPISVQAVPGVQVATVAIGTDFQALRSNFSYYNSANPKAFGEALQSWFAPEDSSVVFGIMKTPAHTLPERFPPGEFGSMTKIVDTRVAFVAIATDLNHVRSDLIYYSKADESGYFAALRSNFPPEESTLIESIRSRPEPFGQKR